MGFHVLCVQEIFSVKLPGDPKLGEGKPENQNHAIIFTRGEAMQTIDMNQVLVIFFLIKTHVIIVCIIVYKFYLNMLVLSGKSIF